LDIVVVVEEERPIDPAAAFAEDDGIPDRLQRADGEAARLEHLGDEGSAFPDSLAAGRNARLGAEAGQLRQRRIQTSGDDPVDGGQLGHEVPPQRIDARDCRCDVFVPTQAKETSHLRHLL
jgi:hypothetical protein